MTASPFPVSFSKPGEGHLIARLLPHGISGLVKTTFQYPLKIITPPSPVGDLKSALAFLLTYGGGLVGGDQVHLKVRTKFHTLLNHPQRSRPARHFVLQIIF
jgi:urease accessory protein